jgi:hypothetical protein
MQTQCVWHVCSIKKLHRYQQAGRIQAPVRAWRSIASAERFSRQTGRYVILRLKFPRDAKQLPGHRGEAVYLDRDYTAVDNW